MPPRPALRLAAVMLALTLTGTLALPGPLGAQDRPVAGPFLAVPPAEALSRAAGAEVLLVDIRRPEEWRETGVMPEALLLTFETPETFLAALAPHLDGRPVALICRSGNRTAAAAALLAPRLGVPVIDIGGGMLRLMAEGYRPAAPTRARGCTSC